MPGAGEGGCLDEELARRSRRGEPSRDAKPAGFIFCQSAPTVAPCRDLAPIIAFHRPGGGMDWINSIATGAGETVVAVREESAS